MNTPVNNYPITIDINSDDEITTIDSKGNILKFVGYDHEWEATYNKEGKTLTYKSISDGVKYNSWYTYHENGVEKSWSNSEGDCQTYNESGIPVEDNGSF